MKTVTRHRVPVRGRRAGNCFMRPLAGVPGAALVSALLFLWDDQMLNILAFAIMVALGLYYDLSWNFFILLTVGSLMSIAAGFASFSRGTYFIGGRGDVIAALCMIIAVVDAIAIASQHGFLWGVASAILFWPTMYRLGVNILILLGGARFHSPIASEHSGIEILNKMKSRSDKRKIGFAHAVIGLVIFAIVFVATCVNFGSGPTGKTLYYIDDHNVYYSPPLMESDPRPFAYAMFAEDAIAEGFQPLDTAISHETNYDALVFGNPKEKRWVLSSAPHGHYT